MKLRTDTIGTINNPGNEELEWAFKPQIKPVQDNDIIRLEIDDNNYVAAWYYSDNKNFLIVLSQKGRQSQIRQKLPLHETLSLFKKYKNNDFTWIANNEWKDTSWQEVKDSLDL